MMAHPGWISILVKTVRKPKLLMAVAGVLLGTSITLESLQPQTKGRTRPQKPAKIRT